MAMKLVYVLLILSMLMAVGLSIIKRKVMINFGEVTVQNVFSFWFWFKFFTTPSIIIVLLINLGLFALNMWVFSLIGVNKTAILSWGLTIPSFFLTFFLSSIFLGEKIVPAQYPYVLILIVSILLSLWGIQGFMNVG